MRINPPLSEEEPPKFSDVSMGDPSSTPKLLSEMDDVIDDENDDSNLKNLRSTKHGPEGNEV
jgi:hypothetical protein